MKVGSRSIMVFKDPHGLGPAIFNSLHSQLNKQEEQFQLSLEKYGIRDVKACGQVLHFLHPHSNSDEVTVLLLENYEPPVVACVINEVLQSIIEDNSSSTPTLILPYFLPPSKSNSEMIDQAIGNRKVPLYSTQIGPETSFGQAMLGGTEKLPTSLQIHYEPLACLLHLVHILRLPTILLVGPRGRYQSKGTTEETFEALHEMGEFLAANTGLCFTRDKFHLNLAEKVKASQEPWRALYG